MLKTIDILDSLCTHFLIKYLCSVGKSRGNKGEIKGKFQANKYVFKQTYRNTKKS